MSKMQNPKFYQIALEAGGSHYPEVGGQLLEQALAMVVKQCAEIALREEHDPSDCILKHFGVSRD